ncbi:MAG: aminotransferase class V-fold PLP-dependent enzyme [Candidatus Peregrinibacteria bacterium]
MNAPFEKTLNPGPSQISNATRQDIENAMTHRIGEISHRSAQFSTISGECITGLRDFLKIPAEYSVFYTSSATEAMSRTIANLVEETSFHFVNGAFSHKFAEVSELLGKKSLHNTVAYGQKNAFFSTEIPEEAELITLTINETSTGVMIQNEEIWGMRKRHPEKLLVGDITSIAGGKHIPLEAADVWLFSVQKCFGLPAGLGIIILSPRALEKSQKLLEKGKNLGGCFSFPILHKSMEKNFQTVETPNVLAIYLLAQQCKRWNSAGGIAAREQETLRKKELFWEILARQQKFSLVPESVESVSDTVFCISGTEEDIKKAHEKAKEKGFALGKGYGKIKETSFRIANFPNILEDDMQSVLATIME